jgi:EAL domain-containing protein (putative c-di-GMP-specific phosphodiesterase class I)
MTCEGCTTAHRLDVDVSMAFQPIYDAVADRVWGYEALVRGVDGQGAAEILAMVTPEHKYRFDQDCRVTAIELASRLFPDPENLMLSINIMPNAVYEPVACLRATLRAAERFGFPQTSIMFEFTEDEQVIDPAHLTSIVTEYAKQGFMTAIDDFGAGHSGLNRLVQLQPDLIKIDMLIVRGIDDDVRRQAILSGVVHMAEALGVVVLAEGIETEAEYLTLRAAGIRLFQGYWFARPAFESLPPLQNPVAVAVA